VQRHGQQARTQLLAAYSGSMFPQGSGSDSILYATVRPTPDLGIILQQSNNEWTLEQPSFDSTDLPGNGRVSVATAANATLLRLERANQDASYEFYHDSKAFMDIALKGLTIRRVVGTDTVRVTSLGAATTDSLWTDHYGRRWQQ